MSKFVERFKEMLKENDLNVKSFSKIIGISDATIYDWINHDRLPTLQFLAKICKFFDCSCDYIIGRIDIDKDFTKHEMLSFPIALNLAIDKNKTNINKLSVATGFDTTLIYRWLNGKFTPNVESLVRLADYFRCSVDELLGIER